MADPMYSGGPDQFQDRWPLYWATFPQFMRDPLLPTDPPPSPVAMSLICAALMAIPVVGYNAAAALGEYQSYYATGYDASPPGSHTDAPVYPEVPDPYVAPGDDSFDWYKLYTILYGAVTDTYGLVNQVKGVVDIILDRLPGGTTPPIVASEVNLSRVLSTSFAIAKQVSNLPQRDNTDRVLACLFAIARQQTVNIDPTTQELMDAIAAHDTHIDGDLADRFDTQAELITNTATDLKGTGDVDHSDIADAIAALAGVSGADARYPGFANALFNQPTEFDGPTQISQVMHGCIVNLSSMPAGTGSQDVGSMVNWLHAGWLCFLTPEGEADEMQFLNLETAVYCPKRITLIGGLLVFPRAGASGTVTGWSRAS